MRNDVHCIRGSIYSLYRAHYLLDRLPWRFCSQPQVVHWPLVINLKLSLVGRFYYLYNVLSWSATNLGLVEL